MADRLDLLDRFYALLHSAEKQAGGRRRLRECTGAMTWPQRGVYFFFEPGEYREDGVTPRVVRVGTHGLRPSSSTLWKRLSQHRGHLAGSFAGGGNHRGSVFRRHVGVAIAMDGAHTHQLESWNIGAKASRFVRQIEHDLELTVSDRLGEMNVVWVEVDDPPSSTSDRGIIEAGSIGLLSNLNRDPIDPCSPTWLGLRSDRPAIARSGLWNVDHVARSPEAKFLDVLAQHVTARHVTVSSWVASSEAPITLGFDVDGRRLSPSSR